MSGHSSYVPKTGIERWLDFDALVRHAQANRERLDPATRGELARLYTWVRTLELLNAKRSPGSGGLFVMNRVLPAARVRS